MGITKNAISVMGITKNAILWWQWLRTPPG
jgi:hypothetical protein